FWRPAIRSGGAPPLFVCLLWGSGVAAPLDYRGRFLRASFFGVVGFSGFSILAFVGLGRSRPEHAAIIMALQTPIAAFAHWVLKGTRPAIFTLGCIAAAIAGVFMVITKGDLGNTFAGGTLVGDLLIFLGAMSWIVYSIGAVSFPGWSALRFSTLTALPGTVGIFVRSEEHTSELQSLTNLVC